MADQTISEEQKQTSVRIYLSFRASTRTSTGRATPTGVAPTQLLTQIRPARPGHVATA